MKYLLATAVLLALASVSAAQAQRIALPDTIVGEWCAKDQSDSNPYFYHRFRGDCDTYRLVIRQDGSTDFDADCAFDKVEQTAPNVYRAHTRCEAIAEGTGSPNGFVFSRTIELRIVDEQLVVTELSEG
jgi:hypothetical protein